MNCRSFLLGILAVMLLFTSCSKSDDLTNAIPNDAAYVVYIDNEALIKKSEYDIFKNQTIERGINMAKAFIKDQEQVKLIDAFLKDANSLGLNLKNDVYMYTNYKVYGIVLGVNDASKLKNTLLVSSLIKEDQLTEEGGIYSVSPERDVCLAWDKDKMLFLVNIGKALGSDTEIDITEIAKAQLKQTAANSINADKSFEVFAKKKKDISVFYKTAGLEEFSKLAMNKANVVGGFDFTKYIQEFKGISVGLYGSFEKGAVVYDSEYYYDTDEDKARYTQFVSQFVGPLKGDHLKYFAADPLFLASVNVKGASAGENLKKLGVFDTLSNEINDSTSMSIIENVLAKVNGDVTLALTGFSVNVDNTIVATESDDSDDELFEEETDTQSVPQLALLADINDSEYIVNLIKSKLPENTTVTTISPAVFSLPYEGNIKIYFGVVNNVFFATNIESLYNNLSVSDLKNNYQDKIKGNSMVVFGDLGVLKNSLEQNDFGISAKELATIIGVLSPLSKYELAVSEDISSNAQLELVNKDQNSLKTICQEIDRLINESAASFF